ncbi:MAG: hypothetical protein OCC46_08045 [Pseudodesulfovibrio sp.]
MSLGKGLLLVGGTMALASVMGSAPLLLISKSFLGLGGTTVHVGARAITGLCMGAMAGVSAAKISSSAGTALIVSGLDDVSQGLYHRLSGNKDEATAEE